MLIHRRADGSSFEAAEVALDKAGIDGDRLRRSGGDDFGGLYRADQRTADDDIDRRVPCSRRAAECACATPSSFKGMSVRP